MSDFLVYPHPQNLDIIYECPQSNSYLTKHQLRKRPPSCLWFKAYQESWVNCFTSLINDYNEVLTHTFRLCWHNSDFRFKVMSNPNHAKFCVLRNLSLVCFTYPYLICEFISSMLRFLSSFFDNFLGKISKADIHYYVNYFEKNWLNRLNLDFDILVHIQKRFKNQIFHSKFWRPGFLNAKIKFTTIIYSIFLSKKLPSNM